MSKVYSFKKVQTIPVSLTEAWNFFSDPSNLAAITPADMGFKVLPAYNESKMYPGQLIEYIVSPIAGIRLYWMTEITHVQSPHFFVDEQRFGPYSFWHHQHFFKEIDAGVEMTDIVHYKIPYGFLGDIANTFFVKNKLEKIFDYRYTAVDKKFKR